MATMFFKCIKEIPVPQAPILKHFTEGKVYTGRKSRLSDEYKIHDNFKEPRFVFGDWVTEHFEILEKPPAPAEVKPRELKVWTNGKMIRKYVGQDKDVKKGWYVAKAILVPWEESE